MFVHYRHVRAYHQQREADWRRKWAGGRWSRNAAAARSPSAAWHRRAAQWMGVRMVRWGTRMSHYGATAPNMLGRS
jgi:hypothetical protein